MLRASSRDEGRPHAMLYAGLDRSRKRLDFCLLDELGEKVEAGAAPPDADGVPYSDPRYPHVFGRVQIGVVYTGGSKIAEHGGDNPGDRDVPVFVYAPGTVKPASSDQ